METVTHKCQLSSNTGQVDRGTTVESPGKNARTQKVEEAHGPLPGPEGPLHTDPKEFGDSRPCSTFGPLRVRLLSIRALTWMGECPGLLQATGRLLGSEAMEGMTPGNDPGMTMKG